MSVRAGIVVTGTEVITGRITDRNGPWVSEQLEGLGCEVSHLICVGDRRDDLLATLEFLVDGGVDLIVTTGGLGPTADDLTAEVVGQLAGVEMVLDESMERRITEIVAAFAARMKFDPEGMAAGTRKQAMVPEGSHPLDPAGTAPGLVVEAGDAAIVVLPGPPRELQQMWPVAIESPALQRVLAGADRFTVRTMKMFGVPESTLAKSLREIGEHAEIDRLEVTTCLRGGAELEIDVRYRDGEEGLLEALFAGLRERHEEFIYTDRGESIDRIVAEALAGRTIGLAESCTGGMLASRLTRRPGSSEYLAGGIVAYSDAAKVDLLGVPEELIAQHGAVSAEVARAMAEGAIRRFDADLGVGITGIAGPGGGSEEKPVGYVCICVLDSNGSAIERDVALPGRREDVRERATAAAMHMIRRLSSQQ